MSILYLLQWTFITCWPFMSRENTTKYCSCLHLIKSMHSLTAIKRLKERWQLITKSLVKSRSEGWTSWEKNDSHDFSTKTTKLTSLKTLCPLQDKCKRLMQKKHELNSLFTLKKINFLIDSYITDFLWKEYRKKYLPDVTSCTQCIRKRNSKGICSYKLEFIHL